mmetsp:Transcript_118289/g.341942  ORF Transcript_118289/g.341942 Transcript_118289/m.341942 type:complete len:320 (+) Transcript_118289:98-1057(+)
MEGPILAEFSSLNAISRKAAAPSYGLGQRAPQGARQHFGSDRSHGFDDASHKERLLRGESTFASTSFDGGHGDNFFEDHPQVVQHGVSNLLPKAASSEERERLLRRLEMCAKAREESTKIMSIRFAQRDAVKNDLRRERQAYMEKLTTSQRDRDERWSRKLQRSPFAVDLLAENQRIDEENRVQRAVEQRRQRLIAHRNREAHNAIFKRATAENDELEQLRAEKRMLLENERQLKALKDVERTNARTAQILAERQRRQLEREQQQLLFQQQQSQQQWPQAQQQWPQSQQQTPRSARPPSSERPLRSGGSRGGDAPWTAR